MDELLWQRCISFHGHRCPGLAIGFRAAVLALERLGLSAAAEDEELVCITENDACGVDAVQVVTGCTLGKGNLLFHGTGKMAFSFYSRTSGRSVRLVLKPLPELDREEKIRFLLTAPGEEIFLYKPAVLPLPEKARHFADVTCAACGERIPEHKARLKDGLPLCLDCFAPYDRGW